MSVQFLNQTGNIVAAKITGRLSQAELAILHRTAADMIREQGKVRVLVIAENFKGWEKGGDWGDISAQAEIDPHIEKMAIVGEEQWRELALIFTGQGFREFPIEFFASADLGKAEAWLKTETGNAG